MRMLRITNEIWLDSDEISETFVTASGPGGQNVNKVATAVQLRFDLAHSPNLPDDVRRRAARLAGSRLTKDGVLVIMADQYRSQERNRADALDRLRDLLERASIRPKRRRATRPSAAARERRLAAKSRRGTVKRLRSRPDGE